MNVFSYKKLIKIRKTACFFNCVDTNTKLQETHTQERNVPIKEISDIPETDAKEKIYELSNKDFQKSKKYAQWVLENATLTT